MSTCRLEPEPISHGGLRSCVLGMVCLSFQQRNRHNPLFLMLRAPGGVERPGTAAVPNPLAAILGDNIYSSKGASSHCRSHSSLGAPLDRAENQLLLRQYGGSFLGQQRVGQGLPTHAPPVYLILLLHPL